MFTGDMENWLNEVEVQDARHAELLGNILQSRDFSVHDDASNIQYAFEMAKWVTNHFEYLTYARSEEIKGDALPTTIKSMIAREWSPGGELHITYPSGSSVALELEAEKHRLSGPSTLEKFVNDMSAQGTSFFETVDALEELSSLDDTLIGDHLAMKEDTVTLESVIVNWSHPMSFRSGLRFTIAPLAIAILPYGEPEYMEKLYPFAESLKNNIAESTKITSELVVLAAQHCLPRTRAFFTDRQDIDDFAEKMREV